MIRPLAHRLLLSLAAGMEYVAAPFFAVVALLDAPPPPEHYGEEVLRCRRCCKPRVARYLDAAGVCCALALDQAPRPPSPPARVRGKLRAPRAGGAA